MIDAQSVSRDAVIGLACIERVFYKPRRIAVFECPQIKGAAQ
jgi:hypothetical protein